MDPRTAYNYWASQYDTNINLTRDLEAEAIRSTLQNIQFETCLEIGCGTGKNTEWLITKAKKITAVDLSEEMLSKAREKIKSPIVTFKQANINEDWNFIKEPVDLVSFSLVLEHIERLDILFAKVSNVLNTGGYVYIGELHAFKQYAGSKARFETSEGLQIVDCYTHHISEFIQEAKKHNLHLKDLNEYFDEDGGIPRILVLLLYKGI